MLAVAPHVLFVGLVVASVVAALFMAILSCCDRAKVGDNHLPPRADDWMEERR